MLLSVGLLAPVPLAVGLLSLLGMALLPLLVADGYPRVRRTIRRSLGAAELRWRVIRCQLPRWSGGIGPHHEWAQRLESTRILAVDDAPKGFALSSVESTEFRVFGGSIALVDRLQPLQNNCASIATRVRFRVLSGRPVRLYPAGSWAYGAPVEHRGFHDLRIDPVEDLIGWASSGQMTLGGCESVAFSGDPTKPSEITVVVAEIASFYAVP